jgi:enterochelin esterase-like enzyme
MNADTAWQMEAPSADTIAELSNQWIDPITDEPSGTKYCLYPTPVRGANTQGSYLIYLPPNYERNISKHFPVIYWLHGGFGNARQGEWAVQHYDAAIKTNGMPEAIIVLVQALPVGWYVDSKDGKLPIEQVLVRNLIPHIDSTYRTIAQKEGRGIEGHSMGGYGALHLGLKYPNLFSAIFSVAPSILRDMSEEPRYRTYDTFGDDQDYYEEAGPWNLAKVNARILNKEKTKLLILAGEQDPPLLSTLGEYHDWLTKLGINHTFAVVDGAGHDYPQILEGYEQKTFEFWTSAFRDK